MKIKRRRNGERAREEEKRKEAKSSTSVVPRREQRGEKWSDEVWRIGAYGGEEDCRFGVSQNPSLRNKKYSVIPKTGARDREAGFGG